MNDRPKRGKLRDAVEICRRTTEMTRSDDGDGGAAIASSGDFLPTLLSCPPSPAQAIR
jgi:hypothetical protein